MLRIGKITRTRGNKGEVVVRFFPGAVVPEPGSPVQLRSSKRVFHHVIESAAPGAGDEGAVLAFHGVGSITAALPLVGCTLWAGAPAAAAADAPDVTGFRVYDRGGDLWGTVASLADHSLNRVLEIDAGDGRLILVPWHPSLVVRVDREARVLVIDPPAGLRELNP